jgi:hypothetical protein
MRSRASNGQGAPTHGPTNGNRWAREIIIDLKATGQEQFRRAGAKADAMQTIVLIRLGADRRAPMTVKDLTTGHTEVVPADPGVLAQLEHDVSEGYFEAFLNGGGFSFGNRVPPPDDD